MKPKIAVGCWAMIINDKNQVLLIRNSKLNRNHWECPGGKMEIGEKINDTLIREVKEETNVKIEILKNIDIFEYYNSEEKIYWVCLGYIAKYLSSQLKTDNKAILDMQWFDAVKLPKNININNKKVINNYFKSL